MKKIEIGTILFICIAASGLIWIGSLMKSTPNNWPTRFINTRIDKPDTALIYFDRGNEYIVFKYVQDSTVNEDNQ